MDDDPILARRVYNIEAQMEPYLRELARNYLLYNPHCSFGETVRTTNKKGDDPEMLLAYCSHYMKGGIVKKRDGFCFQSDLVCPRRQGQRRGGIFIDHTESALAPWIHGNAYVVDKFCMLMVGFFLRIEPTLVMLTRFYGKEDLLQNIKNFPKQNELPIPLDTEEIPRHNLILGITRDPQPLRLKPGTENSPPVSARGTPPLAKRAHLPGFETTEAALKTCGELNQKILNTGGRFYFDDQYKEFGQTMMACSPETQYAMCETISALATTLKETAQELKGHFPP